MILRRFMQGLILGISLIGIAPIVSQAQTPPSAQPGAHMTPLQAKQQVRSMRMQADVQALMQNKKLSKAQQKAKFDQLQNSYESDMMSYYPPAQRAQLKEMKSLKEKVTKSITPAQQKQIQAFMMAAQGEAQKIQSDKVMAPPAKMQKLTALNKSVKAKIMTVLSPAQKADYDRLQKVTASFAASQAKH